MDGEEHVRFLRVVSFLFFIALVLTLLTFDLEYIGQ